jgi:flagellar motor component MotA
LKFLADHDAVEFFSDSMRVIILGGVGPFDLEAMMDRDLEVHHHESLKPAQALAKAGDALPDSRGAAPVVLRAEQYAAPVASGRGSL